MPRISDIVMVETAEQPALVINAHARVEELPRVIGESYGRISGFMASIHVLPANIPFVCYRNMDMQNLDVQIGFPVAAAVHTDDDIKSSSIEAGKKAFCIYRGPYSQMAPVYDEMAAFILQSGYEPTGIVYEHYYNGPETPENDLLTKIVMLLK